MDDVLLLPRLMFATVYFLFSLAIGLSPILIILMVIGLATRAVRRR